MPEDFANAQPKTAADYKELLKHLETEHRKANISDKTYKELKAKYKSEMTYLANSFDDVPGAPPATAPAAKPAPAAAKSAPPAAAPATSAPAPSATPEAATPPSSPPPEAGSPAPSAAPAETPPASPDQPPSEAPAESPSPETPAPTAPPAADASGEKKGGFLGKLFHKKTEEEKQQQKADAPSPAESAPAPPPEAPAPEAAPAAAPAEAAPESPAEDAPPEEKKDNAVTTALTIELEKLKTILDVMREQKTASDEQLKSVFESIGEIRSMSIQNDATASELTSKMERINDDIGEIQPKEIDKRFRDINDRLEKIDVSFEKFQAKTDDMSERINKAYELLKGIGGIENLIHINEDVQSKLKDIKEATHYIERLGAKTERVFIDLKAGLDDLVVYRAKQEAVEESIKDVMKNIDAVGGKLEGYATKKDLDGELSNVAVLQKELENISKVLTVVQSNIPEPIIALRKEREDIRIFLLSVDNQFRAGKLRLEDYLTIKSRNLDKLKDIEQRIDEEWKKLEGAKAEAAAPTPAPAQATPEPSTATTPPNAPTTEGTAPETPPAPHHHAPSHAHHRPHPSHPHHVVTAKTHGGGLAPVQPTHHKHRAHSTHHTSRPVEPSPALAEIAGLKSRLDELAQKNKELEEKVSAQAKHIRSSATHTLPELDQMQADLMALLPQALPDSRPLEPPKRIEKLSALIHRHKQQKAEDASATAAGAAPAEQAQVPVAPPAEQKKEEKKEQQAVA